MVRLGLTSCEWVTLRGSHNEIVSQMPWLISNTQPSVVNWRPHIPQIVWEYASGSCVRPWLLTSPARLGAWSEAFLGPLEPSSTLHSQSRLVFASLLAGPPGPVQLVVVTVAPALLVSTPLSRGVVLAGRSEARCYMKKRRMSTFCQEA